MQVCVSVRLLLARVLANQDICPTLVWFSRTFAISPPNRFQATQPHCVFSRPRPQIYLVTFFNRSSLRSNVEIFLKKIKTRMICLHSHFCSSCLFGSCFVHATSEARSFQRTGPLRALRSPRGANRAGHSGVGSSRPFYRPLAGGSRGRPCGLPALLLLERDPTDHCSTAAGDQLLAFR